MKTIEVGILGLGTVGSGVLHMIQHNKAKIGNTTGCVLHAKAVLVQNLQKHRESAKTVHLTTDFNEILTDPEIKIVVELIGGLHPAKEYITQLLQAHKHVVTANKDLIATAGDELTRIAHQNHCDLMYEASVAGGIPILRTINNSFAADQITMVKGIVNGTTNYILTQMNRQGWTYDHALQRAQELGFAEADPTNDVTGKDAAFKMVILSQFAFGTSLHIEDFRVVGIDQLAAFDVKQAAQLGYTIKLVGLSQLVDQGVFVEVAPVLVPNDHPLATINNENNAVMVTGKAVGETLFSGPGAGGLPTANSVLSDLVSVTKNMVLKTTGNSFNNYQRQFVSADPDRISYPYYLSLVMPDITGQMLKLTQIMTKVRAGFSQIVQKPVDTNHAGVVVITHHMSQTQLHQLKELVAAEPSIQLRAAYKVLA